MSCWLVVRAPKCAGRNRDCTKRSPEADPEVPTNQSRGSLHFVTLSVVESLEMLTGTIPHTWGFKCGLTTRETCHSHTVIATRFLVSSLQRMPISTCTTAGQGRRKPWRERQQWNIPGLPSFAKGWQVDLAETRSPEICKKRRLPWRYGNGTKEPGGQGTTAGRTTVLPALK